MPVTVTLLLGSNLGDRRANIVQARKFLSDNLGSPIAESDMTETVACGFDGPDFINYALSFKTSKRPLTLLHLCKRIEREMGRTDCPEYDEKGNRIYHNRIIDIDILFYGGTEINTPELTIPHPQVYSRPFVKILLDSLRPTNAKI